MLPSQSNAQVMLNEVLADNRSAVANGGSFPDFIELHNPTASPVNIGGWSLTDDPLLPRKFVFSGGASVPANGYLIIWADLNFSSPGMHTGFGLGAKGDLVRLYAANGVTVLDEIVFGLQVGDVSLGRVPDGFGAWALNQPSAGLPNTVAELGDPNQLRINEWMARPATGEDWLEVFNADDQPVALGGLVITDTPVATPGNRAIPVNSFIAAGGYIQFFASDLAQQDADHLDFKLAVEGETLTIYAANRSTLLERVVYGAQLQNTSQGRAPDGSDNIIFFTGTSITPGASNFREFTNLVISEVLTHTDPPFEDAIELHNLTAAPLDISHWWLSDSGSQPRKYRIPTGTIIPAYGFKVFYHVQFGGGATGFALNSAEGDDVFLSVGDAAGNLTGQQTVVRFGALQNGVSAGRHLTSAGVDFVPLSRRTFGVDNPATLVQFRQGTGLSNSAPRVGPVVINEIMFYPKDIGGQPNTDGEFLELHNPTAFLTPLYDPLLPTNTFRLRGGIAFDFPENTTIPAGGFLLLVSFDPVNAPTKLAEFRAAYSVPANAPVLGPYTGRLSDSGEILELLEPDQPQGPLTSNPGFVPYMWTERIKYSVGAPWPATAAGTGRSLQRRIPLDYGNEPLNWFGSAPTAGRVNVLDSDGDGMPDVWEDEHGLNPDSPADANDDLDLDHSSNLREYLAGTHPGERTSVFAFTGVAREGNAVRFRFHGVQGRTYSLQACDLFSPGAWQTLTNLPAMSSTSEQNFLVPGATEAGRLFRMITPAVP
ncbi:MAG: lamin tail domain-containing protein [Verrucomicrobia bacterium]|nr:lamin tail domain-containing protein [Verrucomicrobiota bacterium]